MQAEIISLHFFTINDEKINTFCFPIYMHHRRLCTTAHIARKLHLYPQN